MSFSRKAILWLAVAALLGLPAAAYPARNAAKKAPTPPKVTEAAQPQAAESKDAAPKAAVPESKAILDLKETTYDFGTIMEGQPVEHVFEVRNAGKEQLVIDNVKPG
jgi:hypothetical protein